MILRYTVEGDFSATFTSKKKVRDKGHAIRVCMSLGLMNLKEKKVKYSRAVLYDDQNNIIDRLEIKS